MSIPERRVRGDSQQVRKPGTQLIHQRDGYLFIIHTNMDVQAKDQEGASNILILLFQFRIAILFGALLIAPVSTGMRTRADEGKPFLFYQPRQ